MTNRMDEIIDRIREIEEATVSYASASHDTMVEVVDLYHELASLLIEQGV